MLQWLQAHGWWASGYVFVGFVLYGAYQWERLRERFAKKPFKLHGEEH
ncbi:MAG TPA: hypothetical protein VGN56_02275 [Candidatus Paceibacterota bacterium]|jgi:hypothetical protein|nr:hypothetical protein [Candidatus Paceibacterota bacterium]